MSDQQIAASLRTKGGAKKVADLREVLVLMHRARHLTTDPLPLAVFVAEQDQTQNWLELLRDVREADGKLGRGAADDHIRRWLLAYYSGNDSVHRLRAAKGEWVEKELVAELSESKDKTAVELAAAAAVEVKTAPKVTAEATPPPGLDLLGDAETAGDQSTAETSVQNLLDIVAAAREAGAGDVKLPSGKTVPAEEARVVLHNTVKASLDALKRRAADSNRITRPATLVGAAGRTLKDAVEALDDVIDDLGFDQHKASVLALAEEAQEFLDEILALVGGRESVERPGD